MSSAERIFNSLEDEFTRQQLLDKCRKSGLSYSVANVMPQKLKYEGKIEPVGRGKYRKK